MKRRMKEEKRERETNHAKKLLTGPLHVGGSEVVFRSSREGLRVHVDLLLERDFTVRKPHHHWHSAVGWPMSASFTKANIVTLGGSVSLTVALCTSNATRIISVTRSTSCPSSKEVTSTFSHTSVCNAKTRSSILSDPPCAVAGRHHQSPSKADIVTLAATHRTPNGTRIISDALDVMLHRSDFRLFVLDGDLWRVPVIVWVLDDRNALTGFGSIVKVPYPCSRNTLRDICSRLRWGPALVFQPRGAPTARRPNSTSPAPERVVTKATFARRMHCAMPEQG